MAKVPLTEIQDEADSEALQVAQQGLTLRNTYDLALLVVLALALPAVVNVPIPLIRVPLGFFMVLGAPGYALVSAAFPGRADLDGLARTGLSFGLSAAILPLMAAVLNYLPGGIRLWPMVIALGTWIVVLCGVAVLRRSMFAVDAEAASPTTRGIRHLPWQGVRPGTIVVYIAGTLIVMAVIFGSIYTLVTNNTTAMTEFYVLGAEGQANDYPREVTQGQAMQVTLGVINNTGVTGHYRIEVQAGSKKLAESKAFTLNDGVTWQEPVQYTLDSPGNDQQIDFFLYQNDGPQPFRTLHLFVNVVDKSTS